MRTSCICCGHALIYTNTGREYSITYLSTRDEACILGLFHRGKQYKVTSRFIDLGLLLAKQLITRRWEMPDPSALPSWTQSLLVWSQAESTVLHREYNPVLYKYPIANAWDAIVSELYALVSGAADAATRRLQQSPRSC
ncbi:hypothetical protein NDU88_007633 [Pleurodeles waltl]|uniref:Uncharacterized protein n=1 Tax=Pleurodeles waltl TaxID=8319 RepID=A0AAV7RSA9_PLEWA|nr:hypothetical protein NDU88_007633 [Pleurodeles waltl]